MDSDEFRLQFVLEGQQHCDYFLTPLANPKDKSVLVVGSGAGTEMLWCLRHGAREVVGIDILDQTPTAMLEAAKRLGVEAGGRFLMQRTPVEDAGTLGREFDLVLSNNVFEHLPDIERALEVCSRLVRPWSGRIAIFTDPLFYSSCGSHLPLEPWEHLWGDPDGIKARIRSELPPDHLLHSMSLPDYFFKEITLNRMRLQDLLVAVARNNLIILNLQLRRDRSIHELGAYRSRLTSVSATDLTIEGVGLEMARTHASVPVPAAWYTSADEASAGISDSVRAIKDLQSQLLKVQEVLKTTEKSVSFRLGRALTYPGRLIRNVTRKLK